MNFQWKESNKQPYLYIEADNRHDLGLGVGRGMVKQIKYTQMFIDGIIEHFNTGRKENLITKEALYKLAAAYGQFIPESDMEEIQGMHKGFTLESGEDVDFKEILLQSVLINIIYHFMPKMNPKTDYDACTNFGVVNPNGIIVHGQNYDADGRMKPGNAFVHHKLKGEPEAFIYRSGADLATATCKNEAGVCMTVSVIQTTETSPIMVPRGVLIRNAMRADTARSAVDAMVDEKGQSPFSYNQVISDNNCVIGTQSIPTEQRMTYVKNTLVQSNQYDYYDWIKYLKKPSYSKIRQFHSEDLLNSVFSRYGMVTNEDLLEIMRNKPIICRQTEGDGIGTTIAFLTRESFGAGNPSDNPVGRIPL